MRKINLSGLKIWASFKPTSLQPTFTKSGRGSGPFGAVRNKIRVQFKRES